MSERQIDDEFSANEHAQHDVPDEANASTLAKFFILRPVFGLLLLVLFIAWGLMAYDSLVKESMPDLEIPQATITTVWPGADPESIEQEVTEKIETSVMSMRGVKRVRSSSFDSYSIIAVEFQAEADLSESMQLLRVEVDDAFGELPREIEKPQVTQVSVDDAPILSVVLYGDVDAAVLSRTAVNLEKSMQRVEGVNEVRIGGLREEIIRIQLYSDRLAALGIPPTVIRDQIQAANKDMPWGEIESDALGATLRLFGRFRDLEDLKHLPITRIDGGRVIRLEELADVRRDLERESSRAFLSWGGEPYQRSIEMSLTKAPGSDTVEAIANARAELERLQSDSDWPHGLQYRITTDQSEKIWESLMRVFDNAWQAMLCVFVVLFFMLTWREALIAGLSIPLTFLGAMGTIWFLGYTLNEMVLIGMVLALGLLVDVFILMMEGLHDGIFVENMTFGQAALNTVKRFAVPALAGQGTTILALVPLIAITGTSGKFIRILPVTMISCLVISFIVAILIDIPVSRYLLGGLKAKDDRKTFVDRISSALSRRLYRWSLATTVCNRWIAFGWVLGTLILFAGASMLFLQLPTLMYSARDGLSMGVTVELPAGTTLDRSQECADLIGEILREKPYLESVVKLVGNKSPMARTSLGDALQPSSGSYFVGFSCTFVARELRDLPAYGYTDDLRAEVEEAVESHFPGSSVSLAADTGQPTSGDPVQLQIVGDDMDKLRELSLQVQSEISEIPGTIDARDNLGNKRLDIRLLPRREALDFYDITHDQLASQVRYAMDSQEVGRFAVDGVDEDLDIRMGTSWPSRNGHLGGPTRMDELVSMRVYRPTGETVPLMAVVEPVLQPAPLSITREDGQRSITVSSKVQGRVASEVTDELTPKLDKLSETWPAGYGYHMGGEAEEAAEAFGSAGQMMFISLFMVFGLLVLLFGSFTQPFIIMMTIPMALIGTFTGFYVADMAFSFTAMIGIISLIGIVVNDSIVMVETMNEHLRKGMSVKESAARGGADRLRPILSTSITTIIGLIPLMLSDPMWEPLCSAVIYGLMASTVLSLAIIPPLFILLTRKEPGQISAI
ncbi:efflux RND transporter permease subunit [Rubinisphaera margarita]|uniref:efflux RND transporter permease subunit n=1 Tax=Rubinisphaera margarita TaxID=2909586 RepID=UPI001EE9A073|nr:efflux RND transporter permease subunit [Rubinisphaera margarita]MCG6156338.1 efflux RND transporter permease subunit [Rubinisphaera margarita]